jgi:uncharacterized protein YqfA (UPF0365 family)
VATAVIAAHKAGMDLSWRTAAAIDLAGRNILDAVQTSVNPKVIDCPNPSLGRPTLDGVCRNGIQLKARARVTVRTKLDRLVGGATEDTIIARVGEGIVKAIGSAEHHTDVLANPNQISQAVLKGRLDSQTAFEIVSVDVAEVDVGANIGANLQADQPPPTCVSPRQAEKRRALAVAQEEMRAKVEETGRPWCCPRRRCPRRLPRRSWQPARHHGLLRDAEFAGRHADAQRHRRRNPGHRQSRCGAAVVTKPQPASGGRKPPEALSPCSDG